VCLVGKRGILDRAVRILARTFFKFPVFDTLAESRIVTGILLQDMYDAVEAECDTLPGFADFYIGVAGLGHVRGKWRTDLPQFVGGGEDDVIEVDFSNRGFDAEFFRERMQPFPTKSSAHYNLSRVHVKTIRP
jgi:hypothetical protein